MTAKPSRTGAASYEAESSWGEAVDTWGTRLQIHGEPIVPSDIQERISQPITQQYREEGKMGVRGPWNGSGFSVTLALTGHGGTTAGATTETDLYTLLVNAIGGGSSDSAGTTVDAAPTSASEFALVGGTVESGNLIRVGVLGDGRAEGQFAAVDNISTTTLLTALSATPNAADVVYAALNVYPAESAGASITSTRWLLQTSNGQWSAKGCFPTALSFSGLQAGEIPMVTITYGVSRWAEANETFPDVTATDAKDSSIVAAGSCFVQDVGTVTRQTFSMRQWSLDIDLQVQPLMSGTGGLDSYQTIVGAVRTRCAASLGITIDAEASGTNTFNDVFTAGTFQHVLISLSVADGKALGFYFKNCRPTKYVTQEAIDGLNRRTLMLEVMTGTDTTSEETMASFGLAMA